MLDSISIGVHTSALVMLRQYNGDIFIDKFDNGVGSTMGAVYGVQYVMMRF